MKNNDISENDSLVFIDQFFEIEIKERNLPHWFQKDTFYFITFHLADSIPKEKSEQIKQEREQWQQIHKPPYTHEEKREYYKLFSQRTEELLNAGYGSCCLADSENARIVADALLHFDHIRYILDQWVVMPNHVHLIVKPINENLISDITHSWKSFTANKINKRMNKTGQLWMHESYDHIIRNEQSLEAIRKYIRNN